MFELFAKRLALIWRRLKGRFGISAPRVAIKTHVPWYWRALSVVLLSGASLAVAGWIYTAGQRFAGFNQTASDTEISEMRDRLAELEASLESSRKIVNASESRLRIESTAQERLSSQIKALEEENSGLKADLAMFENLAGGPAGEAGLAISRLQVTPSGVPDQYRYRVLFAQTSEKKDKAFKGVLQLAVTVQRGTETAMMQFPIVGDPDAASYQVSFRYFRRMEGTLKLTDGSQIRRVEARLLQDGVVKATQELVL